jgi:hypothetical protein
MKKLVRKLVAVERTNIGGQDFVAWYDEEEDDQESQKDVVEKKNDK